MENKHKFSRWKILTVILAGITILISVTLYYISYQLEPTLDKKLKETVTRSSKGLYSITYTDLNLDILRGTFSLKDIHLVSDSAAYNALDRTKKAPNTRFDARARNLEISGVNLWGILVNKKVDISLIKLDSLKSTVVLRNRPYNSQKKEKKDLYAMVKDHLNSIGIGEFRIDAMDMEFLDLNKGGSKSKKIQGADLKITSLLIDENSGADSTRFLYAKDISLNIPGFKTELDDAPYIFSFKNFKFSSKERVTEISGLSLQPTLDLQAFAKQDQLNKARVSLHLDSANITGINPQKLISEKIFQADSAYISKGILDLSKNKRYQKENVSKIGDSPAQKLMKIGFRFSISAMETRGIDLSYAQISEKFSKEGKIEFKNIHGTLKNVSNDTSRLGEDPNMTADLTGMIYGKGRLSAKFSFDMLSQTGNYSYKGGLSPMGVTPYNRILEPLLNIRLTQGNIQKINFDMQGNDSKNWGKFTFDYNHLKVEVLKNPDSGPGKKGILTFIANKFFINDSNPDANGKYHDAHVDYQRNPNHPFFKVVWKSLLQGIIECTGTDPKYLPGI